MAFGTGMLTVRVREPMIGWIVIYNYMERKLVETNRISGERRVVQQICTRALSGATSTHPTTGEKERDEGRRKDTIKL